MKAIAIQQAARDADALLAAFGQPRPEPSRLQRRRDWSAQDASIAFREPAGTFKRAAHGVRSAYATDFGVSMRRIAWVDFWRLRPDRRAANDNRKATSDEKLPMMLCDCLTVESA